MSFIDVLEKEANFTRTTNGAVALKSTMSPLVDLFGSIGAMRSASKAEIERKFGNALSEDPLLAMKLLFYARDIRGGLGERQVFRTIYDYLARVHSDYAVVNLANVAEFGRWDDLFVLLDTKLKNNVLDLIKAQLEEDKATNYPSLLGKWLKSENTSSSESKRIAKIIRTGLGLSSKEYRLMLTSLRAKIRIVETAMSSGKWTEIDYAKVPSRAMAIYRSAFAKHDNDGFTNYIQSLQKGETKINASTLYPYDIIERMSKINNAFSPNYLKYDEVLEEMWKALPNYISGENNIIVMADTSASMHGRPMATSIGLAIYFAERNKGAYKDFFMTFSSRPSLVKLKGNTLYDKIRNIPLIIENTNLEAGFDLILRTAIDNNVPKEEMPKSLVIITDMQFDNAVGSSIRMTFYDSMVKKYSSNGYEIPNVVFWNVNSPRDSFQVTSNYKGVQLASGQSVAVFKSILANIGFTPYEAMVNTLSNPRYDSVVV